jgi:putative sigma-54 modulation protein
LLNVLGAGRVDYEDHHVVQTERVPLKPMSVEEAIDALDRSRSGAVVFRNPDSERVNVIYHRPDGSLGLIEPEP